MTLPHDFDCDCSPDFSLDRLVRLSDEELRRRVRGFRDLSRFHDPEIE